MPLTVSVVKEKVLVDKLKPVKQLFI
uniref:Uncharacterized protein n=1 Tax=Rhizophora mucronata TaxID=61149 RepID=A0A2P2QK93_RHIMU